jgi:phospholipid-binding lipoprotein MlaA
MASFAVTQALDSAVLEPFSKGYEAVVPSPVRDGIHNVLYNLREPVIAANYLMQHKIGKTGETIARFVINSTIGLAGIFDMAKRKPFKLGYHENGFADTLGFMAWVTGRIFYALVRFNDLARSCGADCDRAALPTAIGGNVIPGGSGADDCAWHR